MCDKDRQWAQPLDPRLECRCCSVHVDIFLQDPGGWQKTEKGGLASHRSVFTSEEI